MVEKKNIFLDMDEVLSSFFGGALGLVSKGTGTNVSIEDYVNGGYGWKMAGAFNIDEKSFWSIIDSDKDFWSNLEVLPWAKEIYEYLKTKGDVTIVSAPNKDPESWKAKIAWLQKHLGIKSSDVILGQKKELLAGNGILIDDSPSNIEKFEAAGGKGILIPAQWNTIGIDYNKHILPILQKEFEDEK